MKKYASWFVFVSFALVLAGCSSISAPTPLGKSGQKVTISGFSFQPSSLTVKAGETVSWTNNDPTAHTVTADDGSFDSGQVAPGATFSHTFTQAGPSSYHCNIHPSMKATIVVE
jgi:plastocyanin